MFEIPDELMRAVARPKFRGVPVNFRFCAPTAVTVPAHASCGPVSSLPYVELFLDLDDGASGVPIPPDFQPVAAECLIASYVRGDFGRCDTFVQTRRLRTCERRRPTP